MDKIRFKFVPLKRFRTEVTQYRDGCSYTVSVDNDIARWMQLCIKSGKQLAREELKDLLYN